MRNTSFTMGLALALAVGAVGVTSAQSANRGQHANATQQDTTTRRGPGGGQRGARGKVLFRGINLTADQKSRIKTLRMEQRKQSEAARGTQTRTRGDVAQRTPRDSVTMVAHRAEMEQRRSQQLAAIRTILTADQRAQFDKNVTELKAQRPHGGEFGKRKGDHEEGRDTTGR